MTESRQDLTCPKCKIETLSSYDSENVNFEFCDQCGGVWFDRNELAEYIELSQDIPELADMRKDAKNTGLSCPKCDGILEELPFSSKSEFLVDRCPNCGGIFLDAGELRAAENASARIEAIEDRMRVVAQRLKDSGYTLL